MPTNVDEFNKDLDKFNKKIEKALVRYHKDIVKSLYKEIVNTSPIWSGQFIASHNVSIANVDTSVVFNPSINVTRWPDPPDFILIPKPESHVTSKLQALKPYSVVFISNSHLYAKELEKGKSQQSPRGIYFISTQKIANRFKRGRKVKV